MSLKVSTNTKHRCQTFNMLTQAYLVQYYRPTHQSQFSRGPVVLDSCVTYTALLALSKNEVVVLKSLQSDREQHQLKECLHDGLAATTTTPRTFPPSLMTQDGGQGWFHFRKATFCMPLRLCRSNGEGRQ